MKRFLGLTLLAACFCAVFVESAEARLFGRRRCRSSCNSYSNCNYSTCNNGCMPHGGPMMDGQDPNLPPGYAPDGAPGAPPMNGQQGVPGQTFYRGNPNAAPQADLDNGAFSTQPNQTGTALQGQTNLPNTTGNVQGSLNTGTRNDGTAGATGNANVRTNTNLPGSAGTNVRGTTGGTLNQD